MPIGTVLNIIIRVAVIIAIVWFVYDTMSHDYLLGGPNSMEVIIILLVEGVFIGWIMSTIAPKLVSWGLIIFFGILAWMTMKYDFQFGGPGSDTVDIMLLSEGLVMGLALVGLKALPILKIAEKII